MRIDAVQAMKDIRPFKAELRNRYKALRQEMTEADRQRLDEKIARRVTNLWQYREAEALLIYVSTPIEVGTTRMIRDALACGKQVAVPRCVPGTYRIEFFTIDSIEQDLAPGSFGVLEPDPGRCAKWTDLSRGLCIVPALAFDERGYRLGYGKGYYDRFLAHFSGNTVGLCYASCVVEQLPHGRYDKQVDLLVTERGVILPPACKPGAFDMK